MDAPQSAPSPPAGPGTATADRLERAERLLGSLRQALSHDLSNQLVAVRGLLQVLQIEEGPRLGADGQDYVRRASAAAERAQALVGALKDLARLGCDRPPPSEAVPLADLCREADAEARRLLRGGALEWRFAPDADRVWAPRRLLLQAVTALLRLLPEPGEGPRRVGIRSRRAGGQVELTFAEPPAADLPGGGGPPPAGELNWLVASELAATCGGALSARSEPGRGSLLTLTIPAP